MATELRPEAVSDEESPAVRDARLAAYAKMRPPSKMGIICIDVTNKCDLNCSNCTRLLVNQDRHWDMSPDNFRLALRSLEGYPGIIAVIGGNPCMHPKFTELCQIFVEEVPNKAQRGLWTNNVFKHADLSKETFGVFNLNPHNSKRGIASLEPLKDLGWYYNGHSDHSSLLAATQDLYEPVEMWERIGACDINQKWSASIVQMKGELKAYFCEVAASFDLARGGDHGIEVAPGWWRRPMEDFLGQVDRFCPGCGVPGKIKGHLDHEEIDTYSRTNADLAAKSQAKKKRKILEVDRNTFEQIGEKPVTEYSSNLHQPGPRIFVVTPYHKESFEVLRRCHDSVLAQQVEARVTHVMVADGHARAEIDGWNVVHIRLPVEHADNGNTPRGVGGAFADSNGADFIAYLDADNWYYPNHLANLLEGHRQTGANTSSCRRNFYDADGNLLDFTELFEDQGKHIDTSCLMLNRSAFAMNAIWSTMPRQLSPVCDRVFFAALRNSPYLHCFSDLRTVGFTTLYRQHYEERGLPIPPNAKVINYEEIINFSKSAEGIKEMRERLGFVME